MRVERHLGRLILVRTGRILTSEDLRVAFAEITALAQRVPSPLVVTDGRLVAALPPSVALSIGKGMRVFNDLFARTAILFDPSHHQVTVELDRLVRESGNPHRRIFTSSRELKIWMSDALTDEEARALDEFLPG